MNELAPRRSSASPITEVALPLERVLMIAHEYEQAGRYGEAEELLGPILALAPQHPDALHLMGLLACHANRLEKAAELIEQAIAGSGNLPLFFRNICAIYERLARYEDALAAGRRAVELDPYDPQGHHNLTVAHQRLLQLDDGMACARRALALAPDLPAAHLALAELLLAQGDLEAGWDEYEWRFQVPGASRFMPESGRPQWDGAPISDGTLLLIADQGFGDILQFLRYIPWVAERCPNLVLACGPEMLPLVEHNYPGLALFSRWDACPAFAAFCPLSGLPRLHGTRIDTIPAPLSYLRAEPTKANAWKRRLQRVLPKRYRRVGIVWAGRPHPPNRSASLQALAPVTALHDIALVSLQKDKGLNQVGSYFGRAPLLSLGHEMNDFMDTAAIIENLDLVVTVDTAVGHLAAAIGKPVWIMLPYSADWRWLLHRDDSPWYPTARLFRQPAPRQWEPVVCRIAESLHALPPSTATAGERTRWAAAAGAAE